MDADGWHAFLRSTEPAAGPVVAMWQAFAAACDRLAPRPEPAVSCRAGRAVSPEGGRRTVWGLNLLLLLFGVSHPEDAIASALVCCVRDRLESTVRQPASQP